MSSKRIDFSLFDDSLKSLINASAKIFPYPYDNIVNNINPNSYEYVRAINDVNHKNEIYIWLVDHFELIGADDKSVDWSEVKNKPSTFFPDLHTHDIIDIVNLQSTLNNKVNIITGKSLSTNDFTDALKLKLESLSDNASVDYSAMSLELSNHKTDITAHSNKADKSYVDTGLAGKVDSSTFTGHTSSTTIHVTQTDKDNWNGKASASSLTTHTGDSTIHVTSSDKTNWNAKTLITQGTTQPSSGYWFKEI